MSTFRVPVVRIQSIEPIPDADKIELAVVGDYRCVTEKGRFEPGHLAVYIPEQAILPEKLIKFLDMEGRLAGADHNRVKAIRLRGCLSQGILLRPQEAIDFRMDAPAFTGADYAQLPAQEGEDLADFLGITKYEPRVPASMMGEVISMHGHTLDFDVENFKAYPDVLQEGEEVEFTEKVHGTFCGVTLVPGLAHPEMLETDTLVYSKGLGSRGLVFRDCEANAHNLYLQVVKDYLLPERMRKCNPYPDMPITLLGEIYGPGVQDLQYGKKKPEFTVFDIYLGTAGEGSFASRYTIPDLCLKMGLAQVPILYRGPFSRDRLLEYTSGMTVAGIQTHIREGVVVVPMMGRRDSKLGRVILKSVSPEYLLRRNKNATEYA